jgi:hypothetical protein
MTEREIRASPASLAATAEIGDAEPAGAARSAPHFFAQTIPLPPLILKEA